MPKYDIPFETDNDIDGLKKKIYKLLPVIEGRDISGKVIYDEITARVNFRKNLIVLINKVAGASVIWFENPQWREILYQLQGLLAYDYPHEQVRQIIFYCTNDLCEKMKLKEGVRSG
jgi:hypothetical protein